MTTIVNVFLASVGVGGPGRRRPAPRRRRHLRSRAAIRRASASTTPRRSRTVRRQPPARRSASNAATSIAMSPTSGSGDPSPVLTNHRQRPLGSAGVHRHDPATLGSAGAWYAWPGLSPRRAPGTWYAAAPSPTSCREWNLTDGIPDELARASAYVRPSRRSSNGNLGNTRCLDGTPFYLAAWTATRDRR
jgi:hypothetical protein